MRVTLPVYGMSCGKCVAKLTKAFEELDGIEAVAVSLEEHCVVLDGPEGVAANRARLEQVISTAGFSTSLPPAEDSTPIGQSTQAASDELVTRTYRIRGMSCANCVNTLEKGMASLDGVAGAAVNLAMEELQVTFSPTLQSDAALRRHVERLGYQAVAKADGGHLVFQVAGMHCASCVQTVEKILLELPGVAAATVNLADNRASVDYDPALTQPSAIYAVLDDAGYPAREVGSVDDLQLARRELQWLLWAALLAVPIMPLMWTAPLGADTIWLLALLATLAQFSAGMTFYRGAWKALRNRAANMDVLVALGITAAYGYSLVALLPGLGLADTVFFETSAMLILFIRFGKWLEARAKGKASLALRGLLQLQPDQATRLRDGGDEQIPLGQVRVGDRLLVRAGEKIPVDGVVLEGSATVDESMVTGESLPVERGPGEELTGATINRNGRLVMEAQRVGADTLLARIVQMVADAQADKAPIQRLADRVSGVFVPVVVVVAIVTLLSWLFVAGSPFLFAFRMAIAVLVIACPCALGLATPTAIMVGSGVGLRAGLLFKRASTLEMTARIDTIVFDKTGTLTEGRFEVTDVVPHGIEERQLLAWVASAEAASTHPLAEAIVAHARRLGVSLSEPQGYQETGGLGIRCRVDGTFLLVGNERFLCDNGIDTSLLDVSLKELESAGKSLVLVAADERLAGFLALSDTVKPDAVATLQALKRLGIRTAMLTGDRRVSAQAIAARLGVEEIHAEVLPGQKQEVIRQLQQQGQRVAMVGDGINDAPALAQADVGIAIGSGTDVAKETGELVLVRGQLLDVWRGVMLGRATLGKIRQNLFWAFFYNVIGIPLAAGLFYPLWGLMLKPEYAGLAMAFSSVSVVSNSLLLKRFKCEAGGAR